MQSSILAVLTFAGLTLAQSSGSFVFCNAAALDRGDCTVPASLTAAAMATGLSPSAVCQAQFDACRGTGDPNEAECAASSAACFATVASATTAAVSAVVTEVVTAFTTVCPSATTFAVNNATYSVKSSTTLTITNCPCTITKQPGQSAGLAPPATTYASAAKPSATNTPSAPKSSANVASGTNAGTKATPTIVVGAGSKFDIGSAFVLAAAAMVML